MNYTIKSIKILCIHNKIIFKVKICQISTLFAKTRLNPSTLIN
jgi:hypothetical protein